MKLVPEDLRKAAIVGAGILPISAHILDNWLGHGHAWRTGLVIVVAVGCGLWLLSGVWSAFRAGEIRFLGIDWERHDYYFKLIVGIRLLLAGFSLWFGINALHDLVLQ